MKYFFNFIISVALLIIIAWVISALFIISVYDPKDLQKYTLIMSIIDKLRALWWINKPVLLLGIGALIGSSATALWSLGKK